MANWNPWHGCEKISPGCRNCYVYRGDTRRGLDASVVYKTQSFSDPVKRKRDSSWKIPSGDMVWTCFSSDFLLEAADEWRADAWDMIRFRTDLDFFFITKRIHRFYDCVPEDWGTGYKNVFVGCTCENQDRADYRLPIFLKAPIAARTIICEPLLGPVDLRLYLGSAISQVIAGGESGAGARPCRFEWLLDIREQCIDAGVPFMFKQTGANFIKDGKSYNIPRPLQHSQARKAGINFMCSGYKPKG